MDQSADWKQLVPQSQSVMMEMQQHVATDAVVKPSAALPRPGADGSPDEVRRLARKTPGAAPSLDEKRRILTEFFAQAERQRMMRRVYEGKGMNTAELAEMHLKNAALLTSDDAVEKLFNRLVREGAIVIHGYRPPLTDDLASVPASGNAGKAPHAPQVGAPPAVRSTRKKLTRQARRLQNARKGH